MRRTIGTMTAAAALAAVAVGTTQPAGAGHLTGPYFDLGSLPAPDYTGKQIYDGLKQFVADFPLRITGTPNEVRSGLALHQEMAGLGYTTVTRTLGPASQFVDNAQGAGAGLKAVIATKPGTTKPNEWIMFIGHYDAVPQTVDAAYDNGAGTNFIRFLAHEFKNVPTNRSLVFVFYNGEEEGVLASAQHATQLQAANQKVAAVLGFDMVGISYPVKTEGSTSCLCIWRGAQDGSKFDTLVNHVNFTYLGFPNHPNKVTYRGTNIRNSDESSFASRGFPTPRWAGMKTASNYNGYHNQNDTIANINTVSSGSASDSSYYEAGIHNTLKSVYYTALAVDNHLPVPAFSAQTSGGDVSVNASGTADEDGAVTTFRWDFGDGTTAEGATASHTYAAPGTYTVSLTVADNLWPTVTRTTSQTVTV